ncbi:hypothetical protein [Vibrio brasiliensis]|uniref:hypothetical protein n=1 Tax=Vibrio brasiliensis TaxID=170652 RepID=UPI001EFE318A|nr:hypothetical protein [Vibrio brasiliensis]MCG9649976.1 hypothetical protein [Vibrio brasiliensis]MCG9726137.1 hypothetical protein [Vibrio brasiliensis]
MQRILVLLISLTFHSATLSSELQWVDYQFGFGYGISHSDNICDDTFYKCDNRINSYDLYYEMMLPSVSIRSSLIKVDDLSYVFSDTNTNGDINHFSVELSPYYKIILGESYDVKLGLGANIWEDKKYGSYLGLSFVNSLVVEKYFEKYDVGLSFSLSYYPNYYNSSSDFMKFGMQVFKRNYERDNVVNQNLYSVDNYDHERSLIDEVVFYFDDGSIEINNEIKLDDFENGDYMVVYGYRSYNENIIISIERARVVQRILMDNFPDSKVEIVNMSYNTPTSHPYSIDGLDSERRVVIRAYKKKGTN